MAPLPVLADDDPVVDNILALAGFTVEESGDLCNGEGLTLDDAKRAAYMTRDDLNEYPAFAEDRIVRSDRDGWQVDTELRDFEDQPPLTVVGANSQPVFGIWALDPAHSDIADVIQLTGYNYDMYAAAATLLEMLASRLKMQFTFSDGSGSYNRSEKYQLVVQQAGRLWAKARPKAIALMRNDLGPNQSLSDRMFESIGGGPWGP